MILTLEDIKYGGKYHSSFWDVNKNFFVSISNCVANCTCYVVGDCLVTGDPVPVSRPCNANNFHNNLANGWYSIPFNVNNVKVGDIIEWTDGCHVARVADISNGKILLNCSWYTGIHGVAVYNGSWDTRPFSSLEQVWDFMSTNYPTRTFHCWELEREIAGVGYEPKYILVKPTTFPSEEQNSNVDQILVKTDEQNVRQTPNGTILGVASHGYYDVISKEVASNYLWYETKYGWIAGVEGRVEFIEANIDYKKRIAELERLNKKYLTAIQKAQKDLEV